MTTAPADPDTMPSSPGVDPRTAPTRASAGLAIAAAATAVGLVATTPVQLAAIALAVLAVGVLAIAVSWWTDHVLIAVVAAAGAAGLAVGSLGLGATGPARFSDTVELVPGLLGVLLLGAGLAPLRHRWPRRLVTAGTATILVSVVASGVVYGAGDAALLGGVAATVVAWDCGEQAVTLGEHVGRRARTWPVTLLHGATSAGVGLAAVAAAIVIAGMSVPGLPLLGLVFVLGGVIVLALALST